MEAKPSFAGGCLEGAGLVGEMRLSGAHKEESGVKRWREMTPADIV